MANNTPKGGIEVDPAADSCTVSHRLSWGIKGLASKPRTQASSSTVSNLPFLAT